MESVKLNATIKRDNCPSCKSDSNRVLYSTPYDKPPVSDYLADYYKNNNLDFSFLNEVLFEIRECYTCGLIYHVHILSNEMMSLFYDEWMTSVEESKSRFTNAYYKNISREIEKILSELPVTDKLFKVLDFGAGWGQWSIMAKAYGAEANALELSVEKKQYLAKQGINVCELNNLPEEEYDIINTEQVFEHIPDPHKTLGLLSTALKPGGIIKISVPDGSRVQRNLLNPDWYAERYGNKSLMPIQPLEHINSFNQESLKYLTRLHKLEPVKFKFDLRKILELRILDLASPFYRILLGKRDPIMRAYFRKK